MAILAAVVDGMTQRSATTVAGETGTALNRLRVLYVHPSPEQRARMHDVLESHGFQAIEAASPQDAIVRADNLPLNLLFVDGSLFPSVDVSALGRLAPPAGAERSFVVAHVTDDGVPIPDGVDGVVREPVDPDQLSSILRDIVDGPPAGQNPGARYPALPLLMDRLADRATIFVDDADRPGESEVIKAWLNLPGISRGGFVGRSLVLNFVRDGDLK